MTTSLPTRAVQRVRHALKARLVEVLRTERISPHVVRVCFGGESLHDFVSASFDDHVKLMLPADPNQTPVLPVFGPEGATLPEGATRPVMRDYTPRHVDLQAGELDIEFVLHGDGPAATWAAQARPGQRVGIGGPRGSFVVPPDYDWHLLIGDETALPAIARRLEELPAQTRVLALIETGDAADERVLPSAAQVTVQWMRPGGTGDDSALARAAASLALPGGDGYAWAAGEGQDIAAVRRVLVGPLGLDKGQVRASAYWKRGAVGHHETLEG